MGYKSDMIDEFYALIGQNLQRTTGTGSKTIPISITEKTISQ